MTKNMPPSAMETNPFMRQQKVMMYLFPIMFAVFGINFPVGVLIYWLVSNLWSMGQQMYVIRRMPVVGSKAHEAMMERQERKRGSKPPGDAVTSGDTDSDDPSGPPGGGTRPRGPQPGGKPGGGASNGAPAAGSRQQPQRQPKSKRAGSKKR
jgi:YidC/Oxa1 family membrane protein insertase